MITKDLSSYAKANWTTRYLKPTSELSADANGVPLVRSNVKMFWFDGIVGDLFPSNKKNPNSTKEKPKSADALYLRGGKNKTIYLIEFKRGFGGLLTKESRTKDERKSADDRLEEMNSSLRMKAIESYVILERAFFPFCENAEGTGTRLFYWVVIDRGPLGGMENALTFSESSTLSRSNPPAQIGDALRRLQQCMKVDGISKPYIYDCIEVMYADEFEKRLRKVVASRRKIAE